jgi:hypothetical protein
MRTLHGYFIKTKHCLFYMLMCIRRTLKWPLYFFSNVENLWFDLACKLFGGISILSMQSLKDFQRLQVIVYNIVNMIS